MVKKTVCSIALFLLLLMPSMTFAAPSVEDSGFAVLKVTGDKVRLRFEPHVASEIATWCDSGHILVAEKWPIQGESMSWYKIVGLMNMDTGRIAYMMSSNSEGGIYSYHPYISANFVRPYEDEDCQPDLTGLNPDLGSGLGRQYSKADILEQVMATQYGRGYSAVTSSPEVQRRMAEQRTLKWAFSPRNKISIYSQPSTTSTVMGNYWKSNSYEPVVVDDSRPGWLLVVDLAVGANSGWVEAGNLQVAEGVNRDGREAGYLVTLNLGANIPEIMRRWGPGEVVERRVVESWRGNIDRTVISAAGFELQYEDQRNFEFKLTRPGAGMGGIFAGVDWCDKDYIQRTFGKYFSIESHTSRDGIETWQFGPKLDGWNATIFLNFDDKGRVREINYICQEVNLG